MFLVSYPALIPQVGHRKMYPCSLRLGPKSHLANVPTHAVQNVSDRSPHHAALGEQLEDFFLECPQYFHGCFSGTKVNRHPDIERKSICQSSPLHCIAGVRPRRFHQWLLGVSTQDLCYWGAHLLGIKGTPQWLSKRPQPPSCVAVRSELLHFLEAPSLLSDNDRISA